LREGQLSNNIPPSVAIIKQAIKHLSGLLEKKKDVFEASIQAKKDYKNILMLSYYRNSLAHIFLNEAFIACSL
jgi:glycerol-3-phosphate O-acyltransferase